MRLILAMLLTAILAVPALAAFEGPQTIASVTTAAAVASAPDNAACMLQGHVVEKVTGSSEKYIFKDASGQVVVEIDDHIFAGRTVTPAMQVKITGKVDTSSTKPSKVDVNTLEIIK